MTKSGSSQSFAELFEPYLSAPAAWFGVKPVAHASTIDLANDVNCRAAHTQHGRYDVVWLCEEDLFSKGFAWPLLLDEGVRLLAEAGHLIVRTRDSSRGTLHELKSMLFRNPALSVRLVAQHKYPHRETTTIFHITRKSFAAYASRSWTLGILSDGRRGEYVKRLAERAVELAGDRPLQIIVAGPDELDLPKSVYDPGLRWVSGQDDKLPRIGNKKHWIVENARHDNIAVFHDRYQIDPNFFDGFDAFGLDFDFATVAQAYEDGSDLPAYPGLQQRRLRWQVPYFSDALGSVFEGHYINGGLMIVKRHIASEINFNPLLLHNEAEDVELSFALRNAGIVPRMNLHSRAISQGSLQTHAAVFRQGTPETRRPEGFSLKGVSRQIRDHLRERRRRRQTDDFLN